jgi:hypothetical protein
MLTGGDRGTVWRSTGELRPNWADQGRVAAWPGFDGQKGGTLGLTEPENSWKGDGRRIRFGSEPGSSSHLGNVGSQREWGRLARATSSAAARARIGSYRDRVSVTRSAGTEPRSCCEARRLSTLNKVDLATGVPARSLVSSWGVHFNALSASASFA